MEWVGDRRECNSPNRRGMNGMLNLLIESAKAEGRGREGASERASDWSIGRPSPMKCPAAAECKRVVRFVCGRNPATNERTNG